MHAYGTAVLDRPAEATVPAQAPQPNPSVSAGTPGLEPANSTDNAAKALAPTSGDVCDLRYGELAVALNASGVRSRHFWSADTAQLMRWAAQGLALLGIDRIRHYDQRTRYINLRSTEERLPTDLLAEYDRMWPDTKADERCHGAAYRLICARPIPPGPPSHTRTLANPLPRSGI